MLRDDARAIWLAGLAAVDSTALVRQVVSVENEQLTIAGESYDLQRVGRICVVGAGKAGAGMAEGLEQALGVELLDRVSGWVNVPEDCVRPLRRITLHAARPAGMNQPTEEGVAGTEEILSRVSQLEQNDLCIVLLSGGGSALLPGPAAPVSLVRKQELTRRLSAAGASIQELNAVRKQLSTVKGGRLASQISAGRTIALIISDVIGDPLDVIASGPTVPDRGTPADAEEVLNRYLKADEVPEAVWERLRTSEPAAENAGEVRNVIIGSNRTAVAAATVEARKRGYDVKDIGSNNDGDAAEWGRTLAEAAFDARKRHPRPICMIGGGETTVNLGQRTPGKGGRNQEIALAAVIRFWDEPAEGVVVLSGGTDGEDGPTDAAGAIADVGVIAEARRGRLSPHESLAAHDSYAFFEATGGLIKTGPTHTNVMDLQVVLAEPKPKRPWVPSRERAMLFDRPKRNVKRGRKG